MLRHYKTMYADAVRDTQVIVFRLTLTAKKEFY